MEILIWIKLICMGVFFLEVVIGRVIANLSCFRQDKPLSIALSFSGGLFLSISILHILPDASHNFNIALATDPTSLSFVDELNQQWFLPYCFIIASTTFMCIMLIDKILIVQTYRKETDNQNIVLGPPKSDQNFPALSEEIEFAQNQREREINAATDHSTWRPVLLQAGMAIHSFFECLAVGLQKSKAGVLLLAAAIIVHKWAEGLSLGLMYLKNGYSRGVTSTAVLIQGLINVFGLIIGCMLVEQGPFVTAIFMSISAGTFLYISTGEVLPEQMEQSSKLKIGAIFAANIFMGMVFFIESSAEKQL